MKGINLRLATAEDGELLLKWRNDPETRSASHSTDEIDRDGHFKWFSATLSNPDRMLFIAYQDGSPVGTVRADKSESSTELSWTVAPEARGKGVAKEMVRAASEAVEGDIKAEVKVGNIASLKVAQHIGMAITGESDGVIYLEKRRR